ncbi:hypothetical protein B0T24DRAFT_616861 [Lasiosphaeria ovina]|uniref:Secreted protein n=1 Tax=Lasiosphaeria ovina TaxID=92902 RepID=A0AAE0KGT8_9PEZI|nr:hypothetical protein B0T24DRAFT_616861 [Lasiosphaeria ovina]
MRHTLVLFSGLAWIHQAAAACCRVDVCVRAIAQLGQGVADCSSNLAVTITPDAVTITATEAFPTLRYQSARRSSRNEGIRSVLY